MDHVSNRAAVNGDAENMVTMKDIHVRKLTGSGSGSRSPSASCSLSRIPTICLAFTIKCLSLLGRKVH